MRLAAEKAWTFGAAGTPRGSQIRLVTGHRTTILCTAAVLAALIFPGMASAASYDFPLSGYWPMNEGRGQVVRDWSGNGNNGQLGSTAGVDANDPTWIRGIYGWSYGLHFDGNQFVQIPDSNDLEPQSMTVSAWFRGAGLEQLRYLVAKGSNQCDSASYGLVSPRRTAASRSTQATAART